MNKRSIHDAEHLRARIEAALRKDRQGLDPNTASTEELLHEISVYLEELEFQNDELQRAKERIRHSEERFRGLFEDAPVGYVLYNHNLVIHEANSAFKRLSGRETVKGLRMDQLIAPASQDAFYFHVRDVERTIEREAANSSGQFTLAIPGTVRIVRADSKILQEDGKPTILSAFIDVTKELQLHQQLEQHDRTLRLYLDSLPQPVIITDAQGRIQYTNRAVSDFYGYAPEEMSGLNPRVLNPGIKTYRNLGYNEQSYNELFTSLWTSITDPANGSWDGVVINRTKNGNLLWVKLTVQSVFNEAGQIDSIIALPVDISGMKTLEKHSRLELYQTIAGLSELRDNETGNHMRRVGILARTLARQIGQGETWCDDIELFAPMHDIGKVGIPDAILLAPRPLSRQEQQIMQMHAELGHAIVAGKSEMLMAAEITLHHHEHWNGQGYPSGKAGDELPLSARIVSIVDVYDALRSSRPYKEAWPHDKTVQTIRQGSGTQFDPSLVAAFLDLEVDFDHIYEELAD